LCGVVNLRRCAEGCLVGGRDPGEGRGCLSLGVRGDKMVRGKTQRECESKTGKCLSGLYSATFFEKRGSELDATGIQKRKGIL